MSNVFFLNLATFSIHERNFMVKKLFFYSAFTYLSAFLLKWRKIHSKKGFRVEYYIRCKILAFSGKKNSVLLKGTLCSSRGQNRKFPKSFCSLKEQTTVLNKNFEFEYWIWILILSLYFQVEFEFLISIRIGILILYF